MRFITLLAVCIAAVAANPLVLRPPARIVGGTVTTIERWPYQANVLFRRDNYFQQWCGGTIINNRSVLGAAHCVFQSGQNITYPPDFYRLRLGSSFASSGGVVHSVAQHIVHPNYNNWTKDFDVLIFRSSTTFIYSNVLQRGTIASPLYILLDNQPVWVTGWGVTETEPMPEQLREVQVYTINQNICNQRYGGTITFNMLCTGVLDVGGRDACQGDSGGPVFHHRIVVGITSFGKGCGDPYFPGVNVRVSAVSLWIVANA